MTEDMPTVAYYNKTSSALEQQWEITDQDSGSIGAQTFQRQAQRTQSVADYLRLHEVKNESEQPMANARRIVTVYIADTNENVPLDRTILYKGDEKLTDSTDQELFFESNIAEKLAEHNKERVKWLDKEATKKAGRDVFLEPAKIRELKMVVVTEVQL